MSTPTAAELFMPLDDADPATPGDPFMRLRYAYGQLLGAEDFTTEQRYFLLRSRLHNAALHGYGTAWGLAVKHQQDATTLTLTCETGLAIDALGREVYVPQKVCLDVTGLADTRFWADLAAPPGAPADSPMRRVYVVLRYRACLTDNAPAITQPCSDADAALAPSRIVDGYRLCLEAAVPDLAGLPIRDITTLTNPPPDARARLLANILAADPPAARVWSGADDAPLLLAVVDLDPVGNPVERVQISGLPDNSVRALLPAVQAVADLALGIHLEGGGAATRFQAGPPAAAAGSGADAGRTVVSVPTTQAANPDTVAIGPVRVLRFDPATKMWIGPALTAITPTADAITITVDEAWADATAYQVVLPGTGDKALLDTTGQPLAGAVGEVVPPGAGRDAYLFATYHLAP